MSSTPHILLLNPWIHDFAAYDVWAKPLGLLTLGAILRQHGCSVSFLNCLDRFHPRCESAAVGSLYGAGAYRKTYIPKPAVLADVRRRYARYGIDPAWMREDLARIKRPDLVFVTSGMTYWYPGVQEAVQLVRERFPEPPVILGGIYASLCPEHARLRSGADEVVTGPAEAEVLELIGSYTGDSIARRFDPQDLDSYPLPAFDLQTRIPYVPILTTRGCPYNCAYCASRLLDPRRLRRSPDSVIAELAFWHGRWGVVDFVLYDDAFLADLEGHALPVLEAVVASGLRLRFHTPNALHVRGITAESARLLFRAGFKTLCLGLETAEDDDRPRLDRKVAAGQFERAATFLRAAGFDRREVSAYLLVGLPGQETTSIARSIDRVKQAGLSPVLAYYSPIPGTALWPAAQAASRYDLTADPLFTNNSIFPCRSAPFSWNWLSDLKRRLAA
jgi:radical SAM superfamily enzyme YgiQ (UPF0313 family)